MSSLSSVFDSTASSATAVQGAAQLSELSAAHPPMLHADREKPLKVTFICRALTMGGAERQLVLLARGLAKRGHDVTVITFYDPELLDGEAPSDIRFVSMKKRGRYELIRLLIRVRRELVKQRPHIVHGYLPVPNLVALIAYSVWPRPKIVWGLRASDIPPPRFDFLSRLICRAESFLSPLVDLVISNSVSGVRAARARGLKTNDISVIPNGVDLQMFRADCEARSKVRRALSIPADAVLIGHFARLHPMKDHENFLQATKLVTQDRRVFALCVAIGSRNTLRCFDERIKRLGLVDVIRRVNPTTQIQELFSACDIYCLSSSFGEGLPNVILEAMACGVPCVVTDVGDAASLVGELGEVAKRADPHNLASALERMIGRTRLESNHLKSAVRCRAEIYSAERLTELTVDALGRLGPFDI